MREITPESEGFCEICYKWKPTVYFLEEELGFEGYKVEFEICKDCFLEKVKEAEQAKREYNQELGKLMFDDGHVYCTNCTNFVDLHCHIILGDNMTPTKCKNCYPYEPEDSKPISLRKNYKPNYVVK